jgi:hypothetical protein
MLRGKALPSVLQRTRLKTRVGCNIEQSKGLLLESFHISASRPGTAVFLND